MCVLLAENRDVTAGSSAPVADVVVSSAAPAGAVPGVAAAALQPRAVAHGRGVACEHCLGVWLVCAWHRMKEVHTPSLYDTFMQRGKQAKGRAVVPVVTCKVSPLDTSTI